MKPWLRVATRPDVVLRASKTAVCVGALLILINQGDVIVSGTMTAIGVGKMLLTAMVPYCVSTYSSVGAILQYENSTIR